MNEYSCGKNNQSVIRFFYNNDGLQIFDYFCKNFRPLDFAYPQTEMSEEEPPRGETDDPLSRTVDSDAFIEAGELDESGFNEGLDTSTAEGTLREPQSFDGIFCSEFAWFYSSSTGYGGSGRFSPRNYRRVKRSTFTRI